MAPRRYQVFVSSTFRGMEAARKAAVAGVSDACHIPIALENFAPENSSDLDVIKREVESCQVYILILGPYYGKIPLGQTKSYTEIEYDLAFRAGRYMVAFTLSSEDVTAQRQKLHPEHDVAELSNSDKLLQFHAQVSSGAHFHRIWRWDGTEEIRRLVALALKELPYKADAPKGLVPETDLWPDLVDSVAQNEFVRDTVAAIKSFDKLYQRTTTHIEAKKRAAEFLSERYHARIESNSTKGVFFESGSSVAFFAKALPDTLWKSVKYGEHGDPQIQITTNNALVYLHLWLSKGIPCAQFPWGRTEQTYGASYGPVSQLREKEPLYAGEPLNERAKAAIGQLKSARLGLTVHNTSLIVMAASGLQLSQRHNLLTDDAYELPEEYRASVAKCFGPHVGSYHNMVFKRYLLETKIPTILLIDWSKIDCVIDVRKCHFVCDNELTWAAVMRDLPFAVCIGCPAAQLEAVQKVIEETMVGFEVKTSSRSRPWSALIARNLEFKKHLGEEAGL